MNPMTHQGFGTIEEGSVLLALPFPLIPVQADFHSQRKNILSGFLFHIGYGWTADCVSDREDSPSDKNTVSEELTSKRKEHYPLDLQVFISVDFLPVSQFTVVAEP